MDARTEAAERILDRGVRFRMPAPFYRRWLHKDRIDIRPLRAGAILEIARVIIENNIELAIEEKQWKLLETTIKPIAQCVAIATLNDKKKIDRELQTNKLTNRLVWEIPANHLINMFRIISAQNRITDFMNITKFFCRQTMTMMNPKNLGQE